MKTLDYSLGTLRTFRTANFLVMVEAVEDLDIDSSFDETGETQRKLYSGELFGFGFVATVYCKGSEVGEDSLWGCIYASPHEFMDHRECGIQNREYAAKGVECRCGSYFAQLIRGAIAEARERLSSLQSVRVRQ